MKRKPARKPTKRKRTAKVQGIPVGGGLIQKSLFPFTPRPEAEVRAEQDGEVLGGKVPSVVLKRLETLARGILEESQRWHMDHSTKPHRFSWGPGFKHFYTAEESTLRELIEQIAAMAFRVAADRYHPEIAALVARCEKQSRLLEQRRENCELLAPEGRAAKKPDDDARADRVCKLYRRIRPSHPSGKRGNGAAVAEVARQIGPLFDRKKPITVQAVRKILKRRGVPCR